MNDILVQCVKGEVIGLQRHSKTDVYSTGGGGYVGQNGGYVSPPKLKSNTTEVKEFFIKTPDGKETHVKLTNIEVPVRDGHLVTMISSKNKSSNREYWVAAVNHDTDKIHYLYSENTLRDLKITKGGLALFSPISLLMIGFVLSMGFIANKGVTFFELDKKLGPWIVIIVLVAYVVLFALLDRKRTKKDNHNRKEFIKKIDESY